MIRLILKLLLVALLLLSCLLVGLVSCALGAVFSSGTEAVRTRLVWVRGLVFQLRDWWWSVRGQLFSSVVRQ